MVRLIDCSDMYMYITVYHGRKGTTQHNLLINMIVSRAADKKGSEDNSKIIFLISQQPLNGQTVLMMGHSIHFKGVQGVSKQTWTFFENAVTPSFMKETFPNFLQL